MTRPSDNLKEKLRCDGKLVQWQPKWIEEPTECCQCYAVDCEGCIVEPFYYDEEEPEFHLGPIEKLPEGWEKCSSCLEQWRSLAWHLMRRYSSDFFAPFLNDNSPFFESLKETS